jgi:hypothetical protein
MLTPSGFWRGGERFRRKLERRFDCDTPFGREWRLRQYRITNGKTLDLQGTLDAGRE